MISSREDAIARLRKWVAAKAKVKASFMGKGLSFNATGRLVFGKNESEFWLVVPNGFVGGMRLPEHIVLSFDSNTAVPCETFEPLLDAPVGKETEFDFWIAEAFGLPCGNLDFREMAEDEKS